MEIKGFRHLGLSVSDVERSVVWYRQVLGFVELFREDCPERRAVIMKTADYRVILGLVESDQTGAGAGFDPHRVGLDHLCLLVEDRQELQAWERRLSGLGVRTSGIAEMRTGPILNCKDPDGIAVALATPPATSTTQKEYR